MASDACFCLLHNQEEKIFCYWVMLLLLLQVEDAFQMVFLLLVWRNQFPLEIDRFTLRLWQRLKNNFPMATQQLNQMR